MKKKEFKSLQPSKSKKPSDQKIDSVLGDLTERKTPVTKKQKLIPFNVKLPENLYNALDEEAKQTGLSKKAVLVNALWDKLRKE